MERRKINLIMNNPIDFILSEFQKEIKAEGLFWRIIRPNTFVDLLMVKYHYVSKNGINIEIAKEIILIGLKAIINMKFGEIDYNSDFNVLNEKLKQQEKRILINIDNILNSTYSSPDDTTVNLNDELSYFKVLNNLSIDNYSLDVFKNILKAFMYYLKRA